MSSKTTDYLAGEGDVIELAADLPTEGLVAGNRGVVVEAYTEPSEAYDVAFEDEAGEFLGLAYSIKAEQIRNISRPILERGFDLLEQGNLPAAEREFRQAVGYNRRYVQELNNFIAHFAQFGRWGQTVPMVQLLLRVDPESGVARDNLAIAYENWAIAEARASKMPNALELLFSALDVRPATEVAERIRQDISAVYAEMGKCAYDALSPQAGASSKEVEDQLGHGLHWMRLANAFWATDTTIGNLSLAYARLGLYYLVKRELERSLQMFEMMDQTGVIRPEFLNEYGVALGMSGRIEEARNAFERALDLLPSDQTVLANLRNATDHMETPLQMIHPEIAFAPLSALGEFHAPYVAA